MEHCSDPGKGLGKREGEILREKNCKRHECHPKMYLCSKFYPNRQDNEKVFKVRGKSGGEVNRIKEKYSNPG